MTSTHIELADGIETPLAFGGTVESLASVHHLIFGHLLQLAQPLIERYHSDLFYDVRWIQNNVAGDRFEFWFGADADGTHIGTDSDYVGYRKHAWRIVLDVRPDRWDRPSAFITVSSVIGPDGWRK